jgi:retinol-binding protein 3
MRNFKIASLASFFIFLISNNTLIAQDDQTALTAEEKNIVVDSVGSKLTSTYVFPEVADEMTALIEKNLKKGKYKSISDPYEFASKLTEDLLSISHDKHIRVRFEPQAIAARQQVHTPEDSIAYQNNYVAGLKRGNFGFKKLSILDGNIGYLDLRGFSDVAHAGPTAVSAMNFLSNSNAIIIDLRMNGGGSPQMIQLISSYLFDSEPVHLNNFYWRPTDSHSQTWTLPHVQGTRSPNTEVYVLTSKRTFSAAEEFSYNLKNLKRATIIGETTGGGAHPGGTVNATDRFTVWIPSGRAINPISNTNWEGTGVAPDIEVSSDQALEVAQIKALESLSTKSKDPQQKQYFQWHLSALEILLKPVIVDESVLKSYIGTFGPREISFENNTLYYQRGEGTKYELVPMNKNEFILKGMSSFRIKLISENGQIVALEGKYDNGRSDRNLKDKS